MKSKLLFLFLSITQIVTAQTFTEKMDTPFDGVWQSSIAFFDVNGDGHEEVLITGQNGSFERIAKLYNNDGTGNFTEMMGTPFDGVLHSSIAFSDVNGNGHEDVLIAGENSFGDPIAKLYNNDGAGNFIQRVGLPFDGAWYSSIAFSDVNGDSHEDVLITGGNGSERITKLYTNDGTGNFTEMMDATFDGVIRSSIAFSDVNGDGHEDVLITGLKGFSDPIAKLYINDGTGNFTERTGTPFDGVSSGSIAFSDVNGDGHEDVLITGDNSSGENIAKLYTNNGTGNFTERTELPFDGVSLGSIAFSDVDGDGHEDVLIAGRNNIGERIAKLYTNDGTGNFTERTGTPFDGVWQGSIAFSDVNGDGHEDVLITGRNGSDERIAKLYTNDGQVSSTDNILSGTSLDLKVFPNPSRSSTLFLSYDSAEMGEVTVKVYNINGILLRQQKEFVGTGQLTFDIASLSQGIYFIELNNGIKKGVAKFIIQ